MIAIAPKDETLAKMFGSIKEAKARGGMIIAITNDEAVMNESDAYLKLPQIDEPLLIPFASIVLLQMLAYHVSVMRGLNPDRPRNLAKSVTVE